MADATFQPGYPQAADSGVAGRSETSHHGIVTRQPMNHHPGIGVDDLPWIHREQFVHYLTVARSTDDATDWLTFRHVLLEALAAALGLDDEEARLRGAAEVVDAARRDYDPAARWSEFMEAVWAKRHVLRPDITWPVVSLRTAEVADNTGRTAT